MSVVALDLGGTFVKGAVVTADSRILAAETRPTPAGRGPDALVDALHSFADALVHRAGRAGDPAIAAGVVVPGIVDETAGIAVRAANLDWDHTPVGPWLSEHLGLPVAFGHDVRAGALAEARLGAGRGRRRFAFTPVGTGIATAVVLAGRPFSGARGQAGEIGHLPVRSGPDTERCGCGNRGCLETLASASAIARRYAAATGTAARGAREVRDRADEGDPVARRVWAEAVEALADGLAAVTTLLDPDALLVGGGLARAGASLFTPLEAAVARRLAFRDPPPLAAARLGDRAGCLGAALLAHDLGRARTRTL
ncbi:ROK family protein (plasmid) [Streptomyces sp. BI20]|uniref:ROK family protein n=1 Tax=Streptomyces sp. BI20 TaxID=3403460 RepID=UPI003C733E75